MCYLYQEACTLVAFAECILFLFLWTPYMHSLTLRCGIAFLSLERTPQTVWWRDWCNPQKFDFWKNSRALWSDLMWLTREENCYCFVFVLVRHTENDPALFCHYYYTTNKCLKKIDVYHCDDTFCCCFLLLVVLSQYIYLGGVKQEVKVPLRISQYLLCARAMKISCRAG